MRVGGGAIRVERAFRKGPTTATSLTHHEQAGGEGMDGKRTWSSSLDSVTLTVRDGATRAESILIVHGTAGGAEICTSNETRHRHEQEKDHEHAGKDNAHAHKHASTYE